MNKIDNTKKVRNGILVLNVYTYQNRHNHNLITKISTSKQLLQL